MKYIKRYSLLAFVFLFALFPVLGIPSLAADVDPNEIVVVSGEDGFYYSIFDLLSGYIYGENAILTAEQNMVLTILATTAVLFVVLVPFLIVFWVIRLISGG